MGALWNTRNETDTVSFNIEETATSETVSLSLALFDTTISWTDVSAIRFDLNNKGYQGVNVNFEEVTLEAPEPSSLTLMSLGLPGLAGVHNKMKKS